MSAHGVMHARVAPLWSILAAIACLALASSGCGPRVAKVVPAEGVLTIGKQPAANVVVQFMPDARAGEMRPTSFGTTDESGRFRLTTHDGKDGAVEGPHTVILADANEERTPQGETRQVQPRVALKYTTAAGGLRAEVKAAGGPITIDVPKP